jgi:hypothetical protein
MMFVSGTVESDKEDSGGHRLVSRALAHLPQSALVSTRGRRPVERADRIGAGPGASDSAGWSSLPVSPSMAATRTPSSPLNAAAAVLKPAVKSA